MDGLDHRGSSSRWRSIKERFGLKGIACCGGAFTTWGTRHSTMSVIDDDDDEEDHNIYQNTPQRRDSESMDHPVQELNPGCVDPVAVAGSGMNLATALAAERQYRAAQQEAQLMGSTMVPGTPLRMSLMSLLEESGGMNGGEDGTTTARGGGGSCNDTVCCVCMIRKKGAAFIPCGHTFCRVCSRELWLNRGSCPLCNRSILEILDIF